MGWISAAFGIGKGIYQAYKVWFLIVPLVALLGGGWLYYRTAENNKERLAVALSRLGGAIAAAQTNKLAVDDCRAINAANIAEADLVTERARQAELRLAATHAANDKDVETINREQTALRASGRECPAIDHSFRSWLRDQP